jgi:hypothetical protein
MSVLLNALEFDEAAEPGNDHAFFTFQAAGKRGFVVDVTLTLQVVPNLAVCALTVPAEIPIRDRVDGQVLKAPEQTILLGHTDFLAEDLDTNESFIRVEKIGCDLLL